MIGGGASCATRVWMIFEPRGDVTVSAIIACFAAGGRQKVVRLHNKKKEWMLFY